MLIYRFIDTYGINIRLYRRLNYKIPYSLRNIIFRSSEVLRFAM